MNTSRLWIAGLFLSLSLLPGAACAMGIELSLGVWNHDPSGNMSFSATSPQDNLSIRDNLKYSDETRVSGRIKIKSPLLFPDIYIMATPLGFEKDGNKGTSFQFGNVNFIANAPFTSELKLDHYDIGLSYGIPLLNTATAGILNVDLGLDARIIDFKARVTGRDSLSGLIVTESKSMVIPVPMLYMGFQVKPLKWVAAEGELRGIVYDRSHYFDIIGRVKLKPFGPFYAATGYRFETVDIDTDNVKARADFGGPFGEIGVEF